MRILLWHGYLLGGTGSNVYTRALAREWSLAGPRRDRRLPGARTRSSTTSAAPRVVRPELPGGLLPVFVLDRYEGLEARLLQDFTPEERRRYVEANVAALRELLPADLVFTNHVLMGGAVGAGTGERFRVKAHGSELEYSMRGRPELEEWGREVLAAGRGGLRRLAAHPRGARGGHRPRRPRRRGAARRRRRRVRAAGRATRRSPTCSPRRAPTRRTPATRRSGCPTRATPRGSRRFLAGDRPTVVYFGKLIENKGVQLLLEALEALDARAVIVGFGDYRAELEAQAACRPERVLFTGPLEHRHLVHLLPLADAAVVPSIFPEAFGMVAAEAAACGCPPLVARHSGLAEVAAGLEEAYPERLRHLAAFATGDAAELRERLARAARAARRRPRGELRGGRARGRVRALVVGGCGRALARAGRVAFAAMGEEQRLSPEEQLATARAAFEDGTDFTVAVEEEFALLDPETLGLVNRFEERQGGRARAPSSSRTSSAS